MTRKPKRKQDKPGAITATELQILLTAKDQASRVLRKKIVEATAEIQKLQQRAFDQEGGAE